MIKFLRIKCIFSWEEKHFFIFSCGEKNLVNYELFFLISHWKQSLGGALQK